MPATVDHSTGTVTPQLRFVKRMIAVSGGDQPSTRFILQQLWYVTEYVNGRPFRQVDEWRDVPMVEAE
jgi:hypothetical protein